MPQRQASPAGGLVNPDDFGTLAPTFGRVGGFLRSIEEDISSLIQVPSRHHAGLECCLVAPPGARGPLAAAHSV